MALNFFHKKPVYKKLQQGLFWLKNLLATLVEASKCFKKLFSKKHRFCQKKLVGFLIFIIKKSK